MRNTYTGNDRRPLNLAEGTRSVTESFDRAASDYDRYARIQRRAAASLARRILESSPHDTTKRILEIGCGTGLLTEHLVRSYSTADWTITDIAPKMVEQCRQRILKALRMHDVESPQRHQETQGESIRHHENCDFRVMDARSITAEGSFDLICSNLAFQWFPDLLQVVRATVDRLAPGGTLIFNTLGADSFSYWRALDGLSGGVPSAPDFPTFAKLADDLFEGCYRRMEYDLEIEAETETLDDEHSSFLEFLHALKIIGANTPIGTRRVTVSKLRNIIRQSRKQIGNRKSQEVSIDYQVVTVIIRRMVIK